jgi:uncharacterized membrane protein
MPLAIVSLLAVAYIGVFGTMALRRHQNLRTNALDLGYTDQAVWNTLHGRPFQFSTYLDAAFRLDIPIQEIREPGNLLAYHVEPLLAVISVLYLIHDGPETLLWLQTVVIALGAFPVYLLARRRFSRTGRERAAPPDGPLSRWLPVAFVLVYLLSPSLEGANLSDFHAVALSPTLLLAAFYFLETERPWGYVVFGFLAVMCKEEVGLQVAMLGLWAAFVRRRWGLGLGSFVVALSWSLFCFMVIMPHFNGLESSAFVVRYGQFGDSPLEIVTNVLREPRLLFDWLLKPEVLRYPRDLLLSSGGLAILYPLGLLMTFPVLAVNTLSMYGWMRSGGGHYSAAIVPFLIIAAIYGVDGVARLVARYAGPRLSAHGTKLQKLVLVVLTVAGLGVALAHHHQAGISPLSRRYALGPVTEHARRAALLAERVNRLPPDVAISAGSNLYPHVGHRERVYLFPTISDAQYLYLDVTGPGSPAGTGDQRMIVRDLLDYGQFGVAASDHGLLLLERDLAEYRFSPTFADAFLADAASPQVVVEADWADMLRLVGFDWAVRPVVRPELVVELRTYWRALSVLDEEYRLVFFFWDKDGSLLRVQPEERAAHWYPTWYWQPGQLVEVALPPLPVGEAVRVGVALLQPGAGDLYAAGRVTPITAAGDLSLGLREENTILELTVP